MKDLWYFVSVFLGMIGVLGLVAVFIMFLTFIVIQLKDYIDHPEGKEKK